MVERKKPDQSGEVGTTGHEWDGIQELNNPLPLWWLWTFYACIVWGIGYSIAYPAWPLISSATQGIIGSDTRLAVAADIAADHAKKTPWREKIAALEIDQIAADPDLKRFAEISGAATFRTYCVQCHGAGAAGGVGYPNLLDDDWIWGGDLASIQATITHGIRSEADPDTRAGEMPAFGRDELLDAGQITAVIEAVRALAGQDHDAALAETGKVVFAENCAACHGEDGKGLVDVGSPNLTDAIWLYGNTREVQTLAVQQGRRGMMPNWNARLSAEAIKEVALYVHSLGGGS